MLRELANVADDAIEKFLRRKGGVTSNGSVQLLFREDRAEASSTSNKPSVKSMTRSPFAIELLEVT